MAAKITLRIVEVPCVRCEDLFFAIWACRTSVWQANSSTVARPTPALAPVDGNDLGHFNPFM
jgi:hypothetical protein